MPGLTRPAFVGVLAALSAGCGTLQNQSEPGMMWNLDGTRRAHRLYGGVRCDFEMMLDPPAEVGYVDPFWLLDVPFSAVCDTLLLPLDIRYTVRQWMNPAPPVTLPPDAPRAEPCADSPP